MSDLPPILRAPMLAELLGITVHSVNEVLRRGEIPASKVAGRWLVRRETFVAFLERRERASRPAVESGSDAAARLLRALPLPRRGPPRNRTEAGTLTV